MANVIWQNNPHSNGPIDNTVGTWTYGKYGGKGWTGGEFTPPGQRPNFAPDGVDPLDEVFKKHDQDYEAIERTWDNSAKTDADIAKYWKDTIAADQAMRESIQVTYTHSSTTDAQGNQHLQLGNFTQTATNTTWRLVA